MDWTDYCNAKCFFCPREEYEKKIGGMGEFIPFARLQRLERVLGKIKYFSISSAIGEPLLHPELEKILTWLYEINPKVSVRATTNGTALTAEKAALFAGHLDWLSVSLNAGNGQAHMRDMFPHLAKRGIDADKRWDLHLRHIGQFIAALPAADRPRVRLNMIAHRHNVKDIVDFVRVVARVGGSHATITNIVVHPHIADWTLYGVRDLYNEAIDQACDVGSRLGVRIEAPKFYTTLRSVVDLDKVCRDPVEVAYISRSGLGAPCCQWTEEPIAQDIYSGEEGFDRYWNNTIFRRLRHKRDLASCQVCNLTRVFDETSFHFSPKLKQGLIASGWLSKANSENEYPEEELVRACVNKGLDLPSIRHTLLHLGIPVEMAAQIEKSGLTALPVLDQACWDAFKMADVPVATPDIRVAGPFLGIGWGPPAHDSLSKMSARWIGGAQAASIFVRVDPGVGCTMCFMVQYADPPDFGTRLRIQVCGQAVETWISSDDDGRIVLGAVVPNDLTKAHGGRLWLQLACLDADGTPAAGRLALTRVYSVESGWAAPLERCINELNRRISEYQTRIAVLEETVKATHQSRSWRLTAPLRKVMGWLHR